MKDLVIDLDDTGFKTDPTVRVNLLKYFQSRIDKLDPIEQFVLNKMSALSHTTMLRITELISESNKDKGKEFSDFVFKHGLKFDQFMLDVKPDEELKAYLIKLFNLGVNIHICTHRGYTENGKTYTSTSLEEHYPEIQFKSIHVINSHDHPNKVEYLNSVLDVPYRLLDDNPIHETGIIIPKQEELVVWEKPHRFTRFMFQQRADNVSKLHQILSQHFEGLL